MLFTTVPALEPSTRLSSAAVDVTCVALPEAPICSCVVFTASICLLESRITAFPAADVPAVTPEIVERTVSVNSEDPNTNLSARIGA